MLGTWLDGNKESYLVSRIENLPGLSNHETLSINSTCAMGLVKPPSIDSGTKPAPQKLKLKRQKQDSSPGHGKEKRDEAFNSLWHQEE